MPKWMVVSPEIMEQLKDLTTEDEKTGQVSGSIITGPLLKGVRVYVDPVLHRDKILMEGSSVPFLPKTPLLKFIEDVCANGG